MTSIVFPWKMLAITASALIILFVGGFLISGKQPVRSQQPTIPGNNKAAIAATNIVRDTAVKENKNPSPEKNATVTPVKNARLRFKHKPAPKKVDSASMKKVTTQAIQSDEPTPLNEMLVMSLTSPNKPASEADSKENEAHPKKGWDNFEKYLSTEAIAPNGKSGSVKLSFIVSSNGSLSGFKIQNSLSDIADRKAVELIKNGPSWAGNDSKQTSEISVIVAFH
jgi:hypothetical protein